ncbi:hypothetical protein JXQ70_07865 [bacterium]|nr:hypothetical protein [bacterium]
MPIYEFKCTNCAHTFEEVQGIREPPLLFCPLCRGEVERKFYDWGHKLAEFRQFNRQIDQAPILPYFVLLYSLLLLLIGILGGVVFNGLIGFLGMIVFSLALTLVAIIGALPLIGPFLYILWLGPYIKTLALGHLGLQAGFLTGLAYWIGFAFSLIFALITTFITIFWIMTPVMWCFMAPSAQEKMKYLLLVHLLNYDVYPVWIGPNGFKARLLALFFAIDEFPAVRINSTNFYYRDLPVKPLQMIAQRKARKK